jgi:hypothetical protein
MPKKCWSEKLKGRDHLEDRGCRWKDNITMDLRDIGCEGMDSTELTQDTVQCQYLSLDKSKNFFTS